MGYYCPFCGEEAYKGHREYKCGNDNCDNHGNPVFGHNRRLNQDRYAANKEAQTAN